MKPVLGKKKAITFAEGDYIHIVYRDSLNNNKKYRHAFSSKNRLVLFGIIENIEPNNISIRMRKELITVDSDQILKLRKGLRGYYYYLGLGTLSSGALLFLISKDALFFAPASFALLAVIITNKIFWDKVLNPLKNSSPESWKRKNVWEIIYVDQ